MRTVLPPGLQILTAASLCMMFVACAPSCCAQPGQTDIAFLARWMRDLQYSDATHASFGGIKVHHSVAIVGMDGKSYYRVSPYIGNLGVLGLLHTDQPGRLQTSERWIAWFFAHLNARSAPDGVPYEHFYLVDGSGETTCVKPGDHHLCNYNDATDSAAATFCAVVWRYFQSGGSAAFINTPLRRQQIEGLGAVGLSLQQSDGLCWAKQDYHAKYLEDNCEVYNGFSALAQLEQVVFKDPKQARIYNSAADRVKQGILKQLYDAATGMYFVAKFEDGSHPAADLTKWYPATQAQVWPHLFGVVSATDPKTHAILIAIDRHWSGRAGSDWAETPERINSGWINADVAYAFLLGGDKARVETYLRAVKRAKFPTNSKSASMTWPFTIADAGWLLMSLTDISK